ncbi:MAG TPA: GNAT family N-acetyltransferase [Burkholderiales bacterium]|nr:GNAT family N-acetyltransferase [Burkholderiales bacterium]
MTSAASRASWTHRLATYDELPGIVAIYNATIPSRMVTADLEPVSVESRVEWFRQHRADFRPLWVATEGARIAGWLSFSTFYGRPAYDKTAELSVYIDEAFRNRGLGSYFLAQAIAHAPRIGVDRLIGFVYGHNLPSLALFAKHGFARWGELPGVTRLDEIERDVVILGRRA